MTATEKFIRDAVEGGWKGVKEKEELLGPAAYTKFIEEFISLWMKHTAQVLLDPDAWRAVGKVRGWDESTLGVCGYMLWNEEKNIPIWHGNWHGLLDALADGKSIEQYLGSL